ncbi:MAG: nuclear transport factor 2 family protein [Muribaculaceae bacterium]|nr:nuclear transport factor 2 family protein [Muribaculaceae bacterium]
MGASDDKRQIAALYERMYKAMIAKDSTVLEEVHADDFVLVHMTGMRQSKPVYIRAIMDGTLNYYSAVTEGLDIHVNRDSAIITGHSRVEAAVFGGGRHTWPLSLQFEARRENGKWRFTRSQASTY